MRFNNLLAEIKEDIFKNKRLLNEAGIRIPKGAKAAKIIHHEDFDGVFSAIITYRQLIKQGISPKHIRIEGIQYGDTNDEVDRKMRRSKGQMVALVDFARLPEGVKKPDFWSDHHQADKKERAGGGRTGAEEFKSDAEHLAKLHTENMVDSKTIDVVNKIDSAGYTKLEEVLKLPKDFRNARRLERLGIICNALLTKSKLLKSPELLEDFIKQTKPSIVSFYNNILRYARLSDIQEEAIKELAKENPDWNKVEQSRAVMPTKKAKEKIQTPGEKVPARARFREMENEDIDEGALEDYQELQRLKEKGKKRTREEEERYQELVNQPISQLRKRRGESAQKARTSGDLVPKGATILQNNPRLQRYLWTQMNKAGVKYPFVIKKYATFLQIAVNPELPDEVKKHVDLGKIATDVMENVRSKFENKYNSWAFKIIEKERGGHKGITNIPALGTLGLMNKRKREELKYLESLEERIKKLKTLGSRKLDADDKKKLEQARKILKRKKEDEATKDYYRKLERILAPTMEKVMPEKAERLKELRQQKEKAAEKRKEIMNEIIEEFQRQFKKRFNASEEIPVMGKKSDVEITGGKEEYEFGEESEIERIKQIAEYEEQ